MNLAASITPLWRLFVRCLHWFDVRWQLREVYKRRDFTGPDLSRLVIEERLTRP